MTARIQRLRKKKGRRKPPGTLAVTRPGRWYLPGDYERLEDCLDDYRRWVLVSVAVGLVGGEILNPLGPLLGALAIAAAEDHTSNKCEWDTAVDVLAGRWRRRWVDPNDDERRQLRDSLLDDLAELERAFAETDDYREDRLAEMEGAGPSDSAAAAVLGAFLFFGRAKLVVPLAADADCPVCSSTGECQGMAAGDCECKSVDDCPTLGVCAAFCEHVKETP